MTRRLLLLAGLTLTAVACSGAPAQVPNVYMPFEVREGDLGAACEVSSECASGFCDRTVPGGMCTAPCEDDATCGAGAACWDGFCFARCSSAIECRSSDFECFQVADGVGICGFDTSEAVVMEPNIGATCRADIECMAPGGLEAFCVPEVDQVGRETGYVGGMCVGLGCLDDSECDGGVCYAGAAVPYCVPACSADADCRAGFACVSGMCGPAR